MCSLRQEDFHIKFYDKKFYHQFKRGIKTGSTKIPENYMACYANVYENSKASGSWKYLDTYSADEVVEK